MANQRVKVCHHCKQELRERSIGPKMFGYPTRWVCVNPYCAGKPQNGSEGWKLPD